MAKTESGANIKETVFSRGKSTRGKEKVGRGVLIEQPTAC